MLPLTADDILEGNDRAGLAAAQAAQAALSLWLAFLPGDHSSCQLPRKSALHSHSPHLTFASASENSSWNHIDNGKLPISCFVSRLHSSETLV